MTKNTIYDEFDQGPWITKVGLKVLKQAVVHNHLQLPKHHVVLVYLFRKLEIILRHAGQLIICLETNIPFEKHYPTEIGALQESFGSKANFLGGQN